MDKRLLSFAGPTVDPFTEAVRARASGHAVVVWSVEPAVPHSAVELEAWNEMLLARGPEPK
ncbi:MAG: hypothetical protein KatS3mg082_0307 [Nitrospiraceae bacterium]|nr:MAG: hypothetical protein KatS3mg082_0307 [Nitrospiraceae bacterium]